MMLSVWTEIMGLDTRFYENHGPNKEYSNQPNLFSFHTTSVFWQTMYSVILKNQSGAKWLPDDSERRQICLAGGLFPAGRLLPQQMSRKSGKSENVPWL